MCDSLTDLAIQWLIDSFFFYLVINFSSWSNAILVVFLKSFVEPDCCAQRLAKCKYTSALNEDHTYKGSLLNLSYDQASNNYGSRFLAYGRDDSVMASQLSFLIWRFFRVLTTRLERISIFTRCPWLWLTRYSLSRFSRVEHTLMVPYAGSPSELVNPRP